MLLHAVLCLLIRTFNELWKEVISDLALQLDYEIDPNDPALQPEVYSSTIILLMFEKLAATPK